MDTDIGHLMFTPEEEDTFLRDILSDMQGDQQGTGVAFLPPPSAQHPGFSMDCFPPISEVSACVRGPVGAVAGRPGAGRGVHTIDTRWHTPGTRLVTACYMSAHTHTGTLIGTRVRISLGTLSFARFCCTCFAWDSGSNLARGYLLLILLSFATHAHTQENTPLVHQMADWAYEDDLGASHSSTHDYTQGIPAHFRSVSVPPASVSGHSHDGNVGCSSQSQAGELLEAQPAHGKTLVNRGVSRPDGPPQQVTEWVRPDASDASKLPAKASFALASGGETFKHPGSPALQYFPEGCVLGAGAGSGHQPAFVVHGVSLHEEEVYLYDMVEALRPLAFNVTLSKHLATRLKYLYCRGSSLLSESARKSVRVMFKLDKQSQREVWPMAEFEVVEQLVHLVNRVVCYKKHRLPDSCVTKYLDQLKGGTAEMY